MQFDEVKKQELLLEIRKISNFIEKNIKNCKKLIKEHEKKVYPNENFLEIEIQTNMNQNLIEELNLFSKKFKLNQELFSTKSKEFFGDEDIIMSNKNDLLNNEKNIYSNNFLLVEEQENELQDRDKEINNILRGVNTLSEMFKDFQTVLIEQGTILDRIDYNIEIAADNALKGKKQIIKVNEIKQKSCFRNIILILLICICVESILLIFKFL